MNKRDCALKILILQIGKEISKVAYKEHSLVYYCTRGKRNNVGILAALFKNSARDVEPAVKVKPFSHALGTFDKALLNIRHTVNGTLTDCVCVMGNLTPAEDIEPFLGGDNFKHLFCLIAPELVLRKEKHTHSVIALVFQLNAELFRRLLKKGVADLEQNSYAVAGFTLGVLACTVFKSFYNCKGVLDCTVRFFTLDVYYRSDTAVVVLKARRIQRRFELSVLLLKHMTSSSLQFLLVYYNTVFFELSIPFCKFLNILFHFMMYISAICSLFEIFLQVFFKNVSFFS